MADLLLPQAGWTPAAAGWNWANAGELVFAALNEGVVVTDRRGGIMLANEAAQQMLGLRPGQSSLGSLAAAGWELLRPDLTPWPAGELPIELTLRTGRSHRDLLMVLKRPNQHLAWLRVSTVPFRHPSELVGGVVATFVDVTAEHLAAEQARRDRFQLEHAANSDALTRLANRRALEQQVAELAAAGEPVAFLLLDLVGFKSVNDRHGHVVGDRVLQIVGARLANAVSRRDLAGRLGGDEFAVVATGTGLSSDLTAVVDHLTRRIGAALSDPISLPGIGPVAVGATIGVSTSGAGPTEFTRLYQQADDHLYAQRRRRDR